jgi:colanic acid/amylovoran biosynthesis protein
MSAEPAQPRAAATAVPGGAGSRAPRHRRDRSQVVRGSAYLLAATVTTAGLGFVFWVIAAQLFTPGQVGVAASLTNSMSLIAYFSLFGLNSTLIRFPAPAAVRNGQIAQSILLVLGVSCVIGSLYLVGLPWYGQRLLFVRHNPVEATALVLFCALSAVNLLTDSVFISARLAQYNALVDGLIQGLTKIALPFALVGAGAFGLVAATGGGYTAAVLASLFFMRRRLGFRFDLRARGTRLREHLGFSTASYVSSLLNLLPLLVVPMIVLARLGAAAAGYYFVAFQIANLANAASYAISESMFAEISADESRYSAVVRRSAGLIAAVQIPASAVLALGSGLILHVFGGLYAARAQSLLVVFAVGALAVAVNTWASFAIKLARLMAPLVWSNVVYAGVVIGLAALWARHGLVWFGWAWCIGNLASGAVALVALARKPAPAGRETERRTHPVNGAKDAPDVVVVNAYVRENAGDAALLAVCLQQVRDAFPQARIRIAGMEDPRLHAEFDGAENIGSMRRHVADGTVSRPWRVLRKAAGVLGGTACAVLPSPLLSALRPLMPAEVRREVDAVRGADLVVSMGGGYFNARSGLDGYQNLFFVVLPALLAGRRGVPVVFAPQSFGPFRTRPQRWLAGYVVRRSALALAREDVSVGLLAQCGADGEPVRRAVDSGFAFAPPPATEWRVRLGLDADRTLVGVTARRWLAPSAQDAYERALAETIDALQGSGARVVLIPQVTTDYLGDDDRIVERRIAGYCGSAPLRIDERVDFRDLKGLYSACDLMLGTRFHSVIFALTSMVPCLAIEYEHKTRGIMRDLGLEEWVLPIDEVSHARLWPMVERLRAEREAYRALLAERLPGYVGRAEEFPALLRGVMGHQPLTVGAGV